MWIERVRWSVAIAACLTLAAAVGWALLHSGGFPPWVFYRLGLGLLAAASAIALVEGAGGVRRASDLVLFGIGLLVLLQVILLPTVFARGWLQLLIAWSAFFVARQAARRRLAIGGLLLTVLALIALAEAAYALAQASGLFSTTSVSSQVSGTLFNPNHFAAFVNMGLGLALGGMVYALLPSSRYLPLSERIGLAWIVLLACGAFGLAVYLTRSRGAWVAAAVTLLFVTAVAIVGSRDRQARRIGVVAAVSLAIAAAAGLYAIGPERLVAPFARPDDQGSRLQLYRDTVSLIAETPVLGVGPGMYRWRFRSHQTVSGASLYQHAHNDYLQTAAEWGVPAALLVWGFVLYVVGRDVVRFATSRDRRIRGVALGCAAATVSILVHSLLDFPLQTPSHLMMFAAIVGVGAAVGRETSGAGGPAEKSIRSSIAVTVIAVFVVGAAVASWRVSRRHAAVDLLRRELPELAVLQEASRLDPENPEPHLDLGLIFRDGLEQNDPARALQELERAVDLNPYNWWYRMELAWLHELQGDLDAAERELLEAVRLNPNEAGYRWRLANFFLRRGDLRRAAPELIRAVAADSELGPAALSLAIKSAGDEETLAASWPDSPASRLGLLRLVCADSIKPAKAPALGALSRAMSLDLLREPRSLPIDDASVPVRCLLQQTETAIARAAWMDLMRAHGIEDPSFRDGRNMIWNGGFELPITSGALDWRRPARGGYFARATPLQDGAAGTALTLGAGVGNAGRRPFLEQVVAVEPGGAYLIALRLRGEAETTGEDDVLTVLSAAGRKLAVVVRGALDPGWTPREARFEVPAGPPWVRVRLHAPTTTLDRSAEVVVDDVQMSSAAARPDPTE